MTTLTVHIRFCVGVPIKIELFHDSRTAAFRTVEASTHNQPQLMSLLVENGGDITSARSKLCPLSNATSPISLTDVERLCQEMWADIHGHGSRADTRIRFGIEFIWRVLERFERIERRIDVHPTVNLDPDRPPHPALVA